MDLAQACAFAGHHRRSVLTTIRDNGRPQLSNVVHALGDDQLIRVSITADRAKYANLRKRPWAALHVSAEDFWSYVVIEAEAELGSVVRGAEDPAVEELISLYRALSGEHPDWAEFRAAMATERRCVLRLRPVRAYGMLRTS